MLDKTENKGVDRRIDENNYRNIKLDKKDITLLSLLNSDSRITIKSLAKKVALSKDSVAYRIKRFQANQILLGFYPRINYEKLGYRVFLLFVLLDESNKEKQNQWIEKIKKMKNVHRIIEYSDRWDYEISILAKDIYEFDEITQDLILGYEDIILEKEKSASIFSLLDDAPPKELCVQDESFFVKERKFNHDLVDYDGKDMQILKMLCRYTRSSAIEIASVMKISPDTVRIRIKKMIEKGIIFNFTTKLNLSFLGYHLHVFVCDVSLFDNKLRKRLENSLKESSHVLSAKKLLGSWDVRIDLLTKTSLEFHESIDKIKTEFANIVRNYQTWVVYKEILFNPFPDVLLK